MDDQEGCPSTGPGRTEYAEFVEEDDEGMTEKSVIRVLTDGRFCKRHLVPLVPMEGTECGDCDGTGKISEISESLQSCPLCEPVDDYEMELSLMQYLILKGKESFPLVGQTMSEIHAKLSRHYRQREVVR